jgi:hypothetical protein
MYSIKTQLSGYGFPENNYAVPELLADSWDCIEVVVSVSINSPRRTDC